MLASKSMRGFFDWRIHSEVPDDVVEITDEEHVKLLLGQSAGQLIDWGDDGHPFLTTMPAFHE